MSYKLETQTRTVTERGITLPWTRETGGMLKPDGGREPKRTERGEVFVTLYTLEEVAEQGPWDSQGGDVLLLDFPEGLALEQAGLAVRETRGGYHRSGMTKAVLEQLLAQLAGTDVSAGTRLTEEGKSEGPHLHFDVPVSQ